MSHQFTYLQQQSSPVNTWPWRGFQVCGGSCGLKEG
jgi:hypothetical protein